MTYFVYLMYRMTKYFTRTDGIVGMMDCNLATYAIYTTDDIDSLYRRRLQRCVHYATNSLCYEVLSRWRPGSRYCVVVRVVVPLEPFLPLCMELVFYQGLQAV